MEKRKSILLKNATVDRLYFILSFLLIFAAIGFIALSKSKNFEQLFWHGTTLGIYPDLFESVIQARTREPYSLDAIYPALAYCLLYPFNFFIPGKYEDSFDDLARFCNHPETLVIAHIFYAFVTVSIAYLIVKLYGNEKNMQKYLLVFVFLFSTPFIFLIERGNTVIITIVFLFVYFIYYDSKNKWLRELALICLAAAAAMKIYPVVFGLLLLADKRIKDAVHAVFWGIAAFVIPFFFMGGVGQIPQMLKNAFSLNTNSVSGSTGFGYGFKVNGTNSIASIFDWLFQNTHATHIKMVVYALMLLLIVSSLVIKERWQRAAALSLVVILMPDFSFIYNVIYLLIPLVLFLKDKKGEKLTPANLFYTLGFVGAFAPLPYGEFFRSIGGFNNMNWSTMVSSLSLIAMAMAIAGCGLHTLFKQHAKPLTAVAVAASLAFGAVPLFLSNQSEPEIQLVEELWSVSAAEKKEIDALVDFVQTDTETNNDVLCFPKVEAIIPFDALENHIWYSMIDREDSITNPERFEEIKPQFIVMNLAGYKQFKYLIKDETVKQTQYEQHMKMQENILEFLNANDDKYSVVKYIPLENGSIISVWELNEFAEDINFWNNGGKGTEKEPYLISTPEQLEAFSYISNSGNCFSNIHIALENDIDASSIKRFTPISQQNDISVFDGIFNGCGHTIQNLRMEYTYKAKNDEANNAAFVNYLSGIIANLHIKNANIIGNCCAVFARVSYDERALIINCISEDNHVKGRRAGEFGDKYGARIVNCIGLHNCLEGDNSHGFVSIKNSAAKTFNCFSNIVDKQHVAAYMTSEQINCPEMTTAMNRAIDEYAVFLEEENEKLQKKDEKRLNKLKKNGRKNAKNVKLLAKTPPAFNHWAFQEEQLSLV